jgi:hypothetical protein
MSRRRWALAAFVFATGLGCRARPTPGLVRLLPSLGKPTLLSLDTASRGLWGSVDPGEQVGTLPSLSLGPGESVSCRAPARAGSRLNFSFAVLADSPDRGFAQLRVLVGGKERTRLRVQARKRNRWERGSVVLDADGPLV